MFRSWQITLSLLLVLLPGLVVLAGPDQVQDRSTTGVEVAPKSFPHSAHVNRAWLDKKEPERQRDCRGCHDFDPTGGTVLVSETCTKCHYDFANGDPSLEISGSYDDRDAADETYQHSDHLSLECRACHTPPKGSFQTIPNDMWVPEGRSWCIRCHEAKGSAANRALAFQKKINAAPRMQANGDAVFKHSEHMDPGEINNPKLCQSCHESMESAQADIGAELFKTDRCGDCHQDANAKALNFGIKPRQFESGSDRAFYHSDHLGASARARSSEIDKDSCLACHMPWKEEGRGVSDYALKPGFEKYEACASCHKEVDLTRDGRKVDWIISDHAKLDSEGNNCGSCHLLGVEVSMKTGRAERESRRSHPVVFDLKVQEHPHITGPKSAKPKECADCHISQVDKAPSRIVRRKFDHKSHISKVPTAAECIDCHSMPTDGPALMEMQSASGKRISYDESKCNTCHIGVEKVAPLDWSLTKENILKFDHSDHVGRKDGKGLDCNRCHSPSTSPDATHDFEFGGGVKDCSACHDHGEHPETTGGKKRSYTDGCSACHEAHVPGLPPVGQALFCQRGDIHSIEGAQFHPVPKDKDCSVCHYPMPPEDLAVVRESSDLLSETVGYKVKKEFHSQSLRGGPPPGYCFACHFHNTNIGEDATEALIDGRITNISGKPHSRRNNVPEIRKVLGDQMKGYPGIQK